MQNHMLYYYYYMIFFFPFKTDKPGIKKITWGCGGLKFAPLINALFSSFH